VFGRLEPDCTPDAFLRRIVAGGVLVMKVKVRSEYAVITVGIGRPGSSFCVAALNALQNSMMFRPRWPRAGPTGGDGFAWPALTCNLMYPTTFLAIVLSGCERLSGSPSGREWTRPGIALSRAKAARAAANAFCPVSGQEAAHYSSFRGLRPRGRDQAFSTCPNSSSTGVE